MIASPAFCIYCKFKRKFEPQPPRLNHKNVYFFMQSLDLQAVYRTFVSSCPIKSRCFNVKNSRYTNSASPPSTSGFALDHRNISTSPLLAGSVTSASVP